MATFTVEVTFRAIIKCSEEKLDEFIKHGNDYMAEPKNSDGCIVAMSMKNYDIIKKRE